MKLSDKISRLKKSYSKMEKDIFKWLTAEGMDSYIISQEEHLRDYDLWRYVEMGYVVSLRCVWPVLGMKQRICIYPNRIEHQSTAELTNYGSRGSEYAGDHNHMLRSKKIKYEGRAFVRHEKTFHNKETFIKALEESMLCESHGEFITQQKRETERKSKV